VDNPPGRAGLGIAFPNLSAEKVTMYEIKYTVNGKEQTHRYSGDKNGAVGWAKSLAEESGSKAVCEHVDNDGNRTHVISVGDSKAK
jgi:hypothetical protein